MVRKFRKFMCCNHKKFTDFELHGVSDVLLNDEVRKAKAEWGCGGCRMFRSHQCCGPSVKFMPVEPVDAIAQLRAKVAQYELGLEF